MTRAWSLVLLTMFWLRRSWRTSCCRFWQEGTTTYFSFTRDTLVADCVYGRHKIWLDKRDFAWQLEKRDSFNSSCFLGGKKGNWIELELGGHIPIFVAKSFVEGARSNVPTHSRARRGADSCVGHSITQNLSRMTWEKHNMGDGMWNVGV